MSLSSERLPLDNLNCTNNMKETNIGPKYDMYIKIVNFRSLKNLFTNSHIMHDI